MKSRFLAILLAGLASTSMAIPDIAFAANRGMSKQSINRAGNKKTRDIQRRDVRQPNRNRNPNRNGNRGNGNNNRITAGNTVVVNRNVDRNYHGSYDRDYHHDRWDDHHDGFFDTMGKAVAVTAGVGLTAAVIGEIFDDEPDNCQQSVHYGQTYLYCNGVWYQPTMAGTNMQYVVVEAPR